MLDPGHRVPEFQLPDLSGVPRDLRSLALADGALLVFYKASCPVCQLTLPYLGRLAQHSALPIIFISQDDPKVAARFNREFGISAATTLVDSEGYPASNGFGIVSVPSIFLVEASGTILRAWAGFSREDMNALGERAGTPVFTAEEMVRVPLYKPG
jgi:peroxiredoxin